MNEPNRAQRLRALIAAAAENLDRVEQSKEPAGPAIPGHLFVFSGTGSAAVQWLVVRAHADIPGLLFLAPADGFPLVGTADVALGHVVQGLSAVRGKCGLWLPSAQLEPQYRVGALPRETVDFVRDQLEALSRDETMAEPARRHTEVDPEYVHWIGLVKRARRRLGAQADAGSLRFRVIVPPREPEKQSHLNSPRSLLADHSPGAVFIARDSSAGFVNRRENVTPPNVVTLPGIKELVLVAEEDGIRAIWEGAPDAAPKLAARGESGAFEIVNWTPEPGPERQPVVTDVPWLNGRVVIAVGSDALQTVTIER